MGSKVKPVYKEINDDVDMARAWGRQIQRDDPAYWESVPLKFKDGMTFKQQICCTLKQYDLDDPALRDLPYAERCRLSSVEPGNNPEPPDTPS